MTKTDENAGEMTVAEADALRDSLSWGGARELGIIDLTRPLTPDNLTPDSPLVAWWRCPACGTGYQMSLRDRAGGRGCPACESAGGGDA